MECVFAKAPGGTLVPCDPAAEAFIASLKAGYGVSLSVKKHRNVKHHRKFFTLLGLAFDMWRPSAGLEYKGRPVRRDFERFREDITILAGHYEQVFRLDGSVRLVAKSISFAKCDQLEFDAVYKSVLDVVWDKVLREANFRSEQEVENVVAQLMSYGG
jgi:hypothetical protein